MDLAAAQRGDAQAGPRRPHSREGSRPTGPRRPGSNKLRAVLPSGIELNREGSQTDENRRMLSAFRWNLRILSYVALLVGSFLIYNTISVSVVRRRAEIGIVGRWVRPAAR